MGPRNLAAVSINVCLDASSARHATTTPQDGEHQYLVHACVSETVDEVPVSTVLDSGRGTNTEYLRLYALCVRSGVPKGWQKLKK